MEAFAKKTVQNREIILKANSKTQKKTVVHSDVTKYLKNHQIDGIKFMFENCFEQNSGCILAHCMGLGKTLQVISLLHAVINSKEYKTNKILVLCPISTIMNWKEEILRWLGSINDGHRKLQILELGQRDDIDRKLMFLQNWSQCDSESPAAICLIMGYDSFRNLVNFHTTKANAKKYKESSLRQIRDRIRKYLLAPADIVICDEGHVIKNSTAGITLAVNQIETKRRIVLTGTPMQNHLMEYYSMVNFVRPYFLGSRQHFNEYFAEPIKSGQHADSCVTDIKYMKQRSYALHKKLSKIVQRREISLLKDFLPEKFEFVLFIPLTQIQYDLYKYFLANRGGVIEAKRLFGDYTCLRKIWTHLKVLDNAHQKSVAKKRRTTNNDDGSNDDDADEEYGPSGSLQMVDNDWWRKAIDKKQLENASSSHKMIILFEILNECKRVGDKCVIFSSFVEVLNVVEYFMQKIDQRNGKAGLENFVGPWRKNEDYYRLDGSTPKDRRPSMINNFNDENNKRTKVLLISAQAGGQGINLFGANRLVLLDTSWNPAKDQQSIFRIYRMGQNKQCYIYRLLSMGTMEEKIYSRSVTKQAMSCRVVDRQQIDRHYSMNELDELYSLTKTDMAKRVPPIAPRDELLAHLLRKYPNMIYKYLEHDSLLANKVEEELNDIEKNEAWRRCQEQNLQMQALNNLMANGEPTATPFKLHKDMLPALELKECSVVNMGKKEVYSQHNKENASFDKEIAGHVSASTINMEHEPLGDQLSSLSDDAQMDVQPSLQRSNSYEWLPPSNASGIESSNDDIREPLLPLESFENGSNDTNEVKGPISAKTEAPIEMSNDDIQGPLLSNFESGCDDTIKVEAHSHLAIAKIATGVEWSTDDMRGPETFENVCDDTIKGEGEDPHLSFARDIFEPNLLLNRSSSASSEMELSEDDANSPSDNSQMDETSKDDSHGSLVTLGNFGNGCNDTLKVERPHFGNPQDIFEPNVFLSRSSSASNERELPKYESNPSSDDIQTSLQRSNSHEWHPPSNASGTESSNRGGLENFENCCGDSVYIGAKEPLPAFAKITTTTETSNVLSQENFENGCDESGKVRAKEPLAIPQNVFESNVSLSRSSSGSNEMELSEDEDNSSSDDVQTSLQRSDSYESLASSNATGINDLRGPLLPLETFENGSNDSHDDIRENAYNDGIDDEEETRSLSAAADRDIFKLSGNLNGNEPEQPIQQMEAQPSDERCKSWLAASHVSPDDTQGVLALKNIDNLSNDSSNRDIQRRPLENERHDSLDGGVERSLTDIVKGLLQTLNNKYAASSQQPYSLEDYATEEQIILPNESNNLEYRITLKRPSSGGIHRPIKRLKLSLEIDPVATLPLTTECQMNVIMENPQSLHNEGFEDYVCSNCAQQSKELVTDPAPTESVENNFNADVDQNEIIVMANGSKGKDSVRCEGTFRDDEEDIFNADVDPDEAIVKTSGSEGKKPISIRVESTFPVGIEDDDKMSPNEPTERCNLNDLSHSDETESVEDNFNVNDDPGEIIVMSNGSDGKESDSFRSEVTFPDDKEDEKMCSDSLQQSKELVTGLAPTDSYEDTFNTDIDPDEAIVKTSGSEGKKPISIRVESTFPVGIEDDDKMSPNEPTERCNLNDLSHSDETESVEDNFNVNDDPGEIIVMSNGSDGKESDSFRSEVTFPDDKEDEKMCSDSLQQSKELVTGLAPTDSYEDTFNTDIDPDEVIVKTSGSEGKKPISIRVESAFHVGIGDDDEMSPNESTERIDLDLSHSDKPAGDDFLSSDEYMEEAVAPSYLYGQVNCIQSENEQDSPGDMSESESSDGDDLHDVQFYEEQPSTMSRIIERCALM
ncbi:DNA excision repair protein ERCC-6-like isoform X2 [Bradysia coprophila]|uniref:DNA excision repair protein ERCC-6-like isoform X2 n=1 Tax=Bradysia coprophila TaxID=38358 RepID=UPI00187DB0A1|nr:DNA excision repair protein ERCC-6-like isoform X2 [Bradysia coprophila]